jgi:hypothetical protein
VPYSFIKEIQMRRKAWPLLTVIFVIILSSCNQPLAAGALEASPTSTEAPPSLTPQPSSPTAEPSPTPNVLTVTAPDPGWVVLDFVASACSAQWSNSANYLACPGNLEDLQRGYVEVSDHTVLEGMTSVEAPLIIGLPGEGGAGIGQGLFGLYPPLEVYPGDTFYATIACQGDADCNLEFSLEYSDSGGKYHDTNWSWPHQAGDGPQQIAADLSSLAGQTVKFYLVLRAALDPAGQWGAWIQPYISRDPAAGGIASSASGPTATPDPNDKTPGVISGMVDMASAPPYLVDSMSGNSQPVAVVFFNLDDGTYWWIHSSLTGHPYYQMTVTPGNYQVLAYARGVGDVPYVAGGYTGVNPSCGQSLKTVAVPPSGRVENVVIADWNWSCGGTAYRPDKPGDVPLP